MDTKAKIKEALLDLALSVIKGMKILCVYILPSIIAALLVSSEFRDFVSAKPELALYTPIINMVAITVADMIKKKLPDNDFVNKTL